MHRILHRINTIDLLEKTSSNFGVEIDIRSNGKSLILHHDPFEQGELFEDWIRSYHHGTLILNVKEEGLPQWSTPVFHGRPRCERFVGPSGLCLWTGKQGTRIEHFSKCGTGKEHSN